jgi:hypothetical protein
VLKAFTGDFEHRKPTSSYKIFVKNLKGWTGIVSMITIEFKITGQRLKDFNISRL